MGVEPFHDGGDAVGIMGGGDETDNVLGLRQEAGYLRYDGVDTDEAGGGRGWRGRMGLIILIMRNLVGLAVDALKVAVGEEYVADALFATEWRLFAPMNADGGCFGGGVSMAKA